MRHCFGAKSRDGSENRRYPLGRGVGVGWHRQFRRPSTSDEIVYHIFICSRRVAASIAENQGYPASIPGIDEDQFPAPKVREPRQHCPDKWLDILTAFESLRALES